MLECVINVSEGRRVDVVRTIAAAAGDALLDVHVDGDHHRSVLTVVGEHAPRAVAEAAVAAIDLSSHIGAHPRIGALDVVPFVPLGDATIADAMAARDRFARWAAAELALPCFLYGPERSLPSVRRTAFSSLPPDHGPCRPHATAGAAAVGARLTLVAYNLWLAEPDVEMAHSIAARLRTPAVQALGLAVGASVQVSMNLVQPDAVGPAEVYDAVATYAAIDHAELVGLLPASVLAPIPRSRWSELDVSDDRTLEARLDRVARRHSVASEELHRLSE